MVEEEVLQYRIGSASSSEIYRLPWKEVQGFSSPEGRQQARKNRCRNMGDRQCFTKGQTLLRRVCLDRPQMNQSSGSRGKERG